GESAGQFSLGGWIDDIENAISYVSDTIRPLRIWRAGFRTRGALAASPGAAPAASPGDFDDWASHPRRLLEHGREVGVITDPEFPPNLDAWSREFRGIRAVACVGGYAPRPPLA